jgi:OmpA-OmpF porin, OOP family
MKRTLNHRMAVAFFSAIALTLAAFAIAQDDAKTTQGQPQANSIQVPEGQKTNVEGIIVDQRADSLILRCPNGTTYTATLTDRTEFKEKKSNPFRGAKTYSRMDMVQGLQVEIKGIGSGTGSIFAREIRVRETDHKVAQTMDTRVVPVEARLAETRTRLSETEQNAQRLSGQIQEVSGISNEARNGAKTAQESADHAMTAANNAKSIADRAKAGAQTANERITALDDYDVKETAAVHFMLGSAMLSLEGKAELEKLAGQIKMEKGFLIEVAGFASSDGDESLNRRLSQKRADAVIQYLAEKFSIPLRRFVTPMGYGEAQPVADNGTRTGRKENRRVEVRILVNKGLTSSESTPMQAEMNLAK